MRLLKESGSNPDSFFIYSTIGSSLGLGPALSVCEAGDPILRLRRCVTKTRGSRPARSPKAWLVAVDGRLEYAEWDVEGTRRQDYPVVGNVEFLSALRPAQPAEESE